MDSGARALVSGFIAFVVATAAVIVLDGERDGIDAVTVGGLTGGAVALGVWLSTGQRIVMTIVLTPEASDSEI